MDSSSAMGGILGLALGLFILACAYSDIRARLYGNKEIAIGTVILVLVPGLIFTIGGVYWLLLLVVR